MSVNTTAPSYTAGQVVTAAQLNALQDGIQAAWDAYTPTLTNITLGNGTVAGRYLRVGKTVDVAITLTVGSTTSASGQLQFSVPVAAHAAAVASGAAVSRASPYYSGSPYFPDTASVKVVDGAGTVWGATRLPPAGSTLTIAFRYEAA